MLRHITMLSEFAVGLPHALAQREVEPAVVIAARFVRRGVVEDRDRREAAIAAEHQAALVGALDRAGVADRARGDVVRVLIDAADLFVQIEELRRA